jgi:DME family drug/metabolite transporter
MLWGTVGPAQVLAASNAGPPALGAARLVVGGVVLLGLVVARGGLGHWRALGHGPTLGWLLLAAASTAAYQAAFLSSVARTGAALSTVVALGVAPPAVGVLAPLAGGQRLTRPWLFGTVAAVAGTALLLLPGATVHIDATGVLLGMVGGICYGITVAAKRLLDSAAPTLVAVSATLVAGGAMILPFTDDLPRLTEPNTLALIGARSGPGRSSPRNGSPHWSRNAGSPTRAPRTRS